jgi:hypothetical protein
LIKLYGGYHCIRVTFLLTTLKSFKLKNANLKLSTKTTTKNPTVAIMKINYKIKDCNKDTIPGAPKFFYPNHIRNNYFNKKKA